MQCSSIKKFFMDNNQQTKEERNTRDNDLKTSFSNEQPGQQIAAKSVEVSSSSGEISAQEQHSESSKPAAANETLGTP